MPQEMNILRCSSCKTFQVHMVKKAKKWQCKVCNFKQTFSQIYFQGSGKDCRVFVQQLNLGNANELEKGNNLNSQSECAKASNEFDHLNNFDESFDYDEKTEYKNESEEVIENVSYSDDDNKDNDFQEEIPKNNVTEVKCTKNIFESNEDIDLTIDF